MEKYKVEGNVRIKEVTNTSDLGEGVKEEVLERYQERVEMDLKQRITRKIIPAVVEEREETFAADGTVSTKVSTKPFVKEKQSTTVADLNEPTVAKGNCQKHKEEKIGFGLDGDETTKVETNIFDRPATKSRFIDKAKAKYGIESSVEVPAEDGSTKGGENYLTTLLWIVAAVVAGMVVYGLV